MSSNVLLLESGEWWALGFASLLLVVAGVWHLFGLRLIRWLIARLGCKGNWSVLLSFWGLAALHLSEILIGAIVYGVAIHWFALGSVHGGYGDSPGGLLYISGVSFATLGYTEQTVTGPLRLMAMVQSLAGFMLITWSATFVFETWQEDAAADYG